MFSKTTTVIRLLNFLQVCPPVPAFAFAALCMIPSRNVLSGYFYVSLHLLAVPAV